MKILIRGWRNIYHSYSIINYFQLKYLQENYRELDIYWEDVKFYNHQWTIKYNDGLDLKIWKGEEIDLIFTIAFPFTVLETKIPQILFYTNETPYFIPEFFNKSSKEMYQLELSQKLTLLTPSVNSAVSLRNENLYVKVIPHGVDLTVYHPSPINYRETLGISDDSIVFLNISSGCGNKNLDYIIRVFMRCLEENENDNFVLILKGNDDLYKSKTLILHTISQINTNYKNLEKYIKVICETLNFQQMNRLYNTADIYVDAGIYEGFCIPIIEALACGLKVVCHEEAPLADYACSTYGKKGGLYDLMMNHKNIPKCALPERFKIQNVCDDLYDLFVEVVDSHNHIMDLETC